MNEKVSRQKALSSYSKIAPSDEHWRENAAGQMERINEKGEVVEVGKKKPPRTRNDGSIRTHGGRVGRPANVDKETHHWVKDGTGRNVWVPKGTNPDNLPAVIYPFSQITCDHILREITEGKSVNTIGTMEGIPPVHIIYRWLREYPEFRAQMEIAKKDRAQFRADKVMAIADQEIIHEDQVPGQRLRKDILQWGAEMDDRASFGKQTKVLNDAGPAVFIIHTGVPDPKSIEVKAEPAQIQVESQVNNG